MKKLFLPILCIILLPLSYSCSSSRLSSYTLNESDAASAIRELLQLGVNNNSLTGAFNKEAILSSIFPQSVTKVINTLNMLGMTSEIDRFTATLGTASEKAATAAVPVFINSINHIQFSDAMRIIRTGGTSATDYLKTAAGDDLRTAIAPAMQTALDEYKLNDQFKKILKPAQSLAGLKISPDLSKIMASLVADAMFKKIAEKEIQVRTDAAARTTNLLQQVFSKSWN